MPLIIFLILVVLIAMFGFWDTLSALLGSLLMIILFAAAAAWAGPGDPYSRPAAAAVARSSRRFMVGLRSGKFPVQLSRVRRCPARRTARATILTVTMVAPDVGITDPPAT